MRYIVLHREGTRWMNKVGNSLHVPFITSGNEVGAVAQAEEKSGRKADAYLVLSVDRPGATVLTPYHGWRKDPVGD